MATNGAVRASARILGALRRPLDDGELALIQRIIDEEWKRWMREIMVAHDENMATIKREFAANGYDPALLADSGADTVGSPDNP